LGSLSIDALKQCPSNKPASTHDTSSIPDRQDAQEHSTSMLIVNSSSNGSEGSKIDQHSHVRQEVLLRSISSCESTRSTSPTHHRAASWIFSHQAHEAEGFTFLSRPRDPSRYCSQFIAHLMPFSCGTAKSQFITRDQQQQQHNHPHQLDQKDPRDINWNQIYNLINWSHQYHYINPLFLDQKDPINDLEARSASCVATSSIETINIFMCSSQSYDY